MSIETGFTTQAILRLGTGSYNFSSNVFKVALYTSSASIGKSTTAYTTTGEYTGTGYTAGGFTLTNVTPTVSGRTLLLTWQNYTLPNAMTPRGLMVYNTSVSNEAVYIVDFGSTASITTLKFPNGSGAAAIMIRFD